jgi:hypothetical protein
MEESKTITKPINEGINPNGMYTNNVKDISASGVSKDYGITISPEEKFWTKLGLKRSDMISPTDKGRFYLVIALIVGFIAYKKIKKG